MLIRLLCTACGRKGLRIQASTAASTVHTVSCRCGARFRIVARPIVNNDKMTIHSCALQPIKPLVRKERS